MPDDARICFSWVEGLFSSSSTQTSVKLGSASQARWSILLNSASMDWWRFLTLDGNILRDGSNMARFQPKQQRWCHASPDLDNQIPADWGEGNESTDHILPSDTKWISQDIPNQSPRILWSWSLVPQLQVHPGDLSTECYSCFMYWLCIGYVMSCAIYSHP